MLDIILKSFAMSMFCYGVYLSGADGMIFEKLSAFSKKHFGIFHKPLFGCIYCMASIWGTVSYILIINALGDKFGISELVVCCVMSISFNAYIYNTLEGE
jgi:hypothetical protein